ncbi:hypothetical protein [Haloarchaeobius iranensis]|uniref:HalX domain-containing protein n=1 Tax=Haloarchaeobius iranensis TaxID=996166 RepID=A0A1G9T6E1_9EURY|nr:hypothetical protein [Haloarchaeobius iranensis]SDM43251.1 hypothetical protein SAMN05192554_102163 [Haloarchaeobius iranensis]
MSRRTPTVLVVAEEELTRERYRSALENSQYDVVATGVPDEVLATAKRASVAAVAGPVGNWAQRTLLQTLTERAPGCALVSLGREHPPTGPHDAHLEAPVAPDDLRATVEHLATRAAYFEQLDAFVAAARRAAGTDPGRLRRLRDEARQLQGSFDSTDFEAAFRLVDAV